MLGAMPLHPLLVHFPVALFIVGVVVQIVSIWHPKFYGRMAFYLICLGEITGIISYLTGDGAEAFAEKQWGPVHSMVEIHQTFATLTLIVFGVFIGLKILTRFVKVPYFNALAVGIALIGAVMITLTGHYGGKIAYQIPGQAQQHTIHPDNHNHD